MDTEQAQRRRDRALLSSAHALTVLERGGESVAVLAATDQGRAAIAELSTASQDFSPLAHRLGQLLVEIDEARLRQVTGSARLDAALHRVQTAWFDDPPRASPGCRPAAGGDPTRSEPT